MVLFFGEEQPAAPMATEMMSNARSVRSLLRTLGTLVPPRLGEVLTAPFLVLRSLAMALWSTGEALLIPLGAAGVAFVLPVRRRGRDDDSRRGVGVLAT